MLPKYENKSENPSPLSFLTYHVSSELSQLVAVLKACVALSDRFLQVRNIYRLKTERKNHTVKN
jgi:hypothetical protein